MWTFQWWSWEILQPVGIPGQSDLLIDIVRATSKPLAASRLKFLSRLTSLLNHTRVTTPPLITFHQVGDLWPKLKGIKEKVTYNFWWGRIKNQEKTWSTDWLTGISASPHKLDNMWNQPLRVVAKLVLLPPSLTAPHYCGCPCSMSNLLCTCHIFWCWQGERQFKWEYK